MLFFFFLYAYLHSWPSNLLKLTENSIYEQHFTFKEDASRTTCELPLNHDIFNYFFFHYCIIHDCQLFQNSLLSAMACAFLDYSVHLGELTGRSI